MGATLPNESRSDLKPDQLRLKELSPSAIGKIKQTFDKNSSVNLSKKQVMSLLNIGQRETDILFDYFDMDGNGQIDNYEFICAIAMVVHSAIDLRSEFLFRLYDFGSTNYLTRDDLIHLVRTLTLTNKRPIVTADVESRTDDLLRIGDLDMDKKLSLKEFQSYAGRNREIFSVFDAYSYLLASNPIGSSSNQKKVNKQQQQDNENEDNDERNENDVDNDGNNFDENDDGFGTADECDPDLAIELQKDSVANEKTEEKSNINKGVEFGNGFTEEIIAGDEFGAVKPWITNTVHTVPSTYQPNNLDGKPPDASLELEFIHGYRCHDTRNNLRYTSTGEFVYHTAAVGIVYNKEEHQQRFFNEHFDDITALAIHPNKKIVATGEMGPYPLISIWDTEENKAIVRIREPLTKGINHLAFSKDGKYLAGTAADDTHVIAVFDWQKGTAENISNITNPRLRAKKGESQFKGPVVGTCEGGRANILNICFNKTGDTVATACVKEVNFFTITAGALKKKKATGLRGEDLTSIMCCAYLNNTLVCGTMKGKLLICAGTQFTKSLKAHTQAMNAIWVRENDIGFITGGSDGLVLTWDTKFNITNRFSIINDKIKSLSPRVRSICEDSNGNLLLGTRGGEIIEVVGGEPTVYLRGHWDLELWGLCVHPQKDEYITVGEDKLLGIWDVVTMKLKQYCVLEEGATSVDISPNGKDLAIGCESGNMYIYDALTLKKKLLKKEAVRKAVEEVKYSPCGNYLAVGGIDKDTDGFMHIFVYDVKANYKQYKKMKGHSSRVTHIDWSTDSDYLQSNSASYELLYHSVSSGIQITKISSMRDTEWNTWTCVLGWPVQGIWPECASGDDINACDTDKTKRIIATSDDYSKVKLFRYPSPVEKAAFNQYNGHSSHVTCIRFASNNKHVFSIGGLDKAIFQFKFKFDEEAAEEAEEFQKIDEDEANPDDDDQEAYFKVEEIEATEFGACKPWIGELQASSPKTKIDKNGGKAPVENIKKLNYVFGYRAFDTRMNVKYTGEPDKIVYTAAALGIVIDRKTNKQKYFTNHEEDIVSLAIHPNGTTVATGQMAAKGKAKFIDLYVWNILNLPEETNVLADDRPNYPQGVINLKGSLLRAIRILQFSPDGTKLIGGGQDDYNSIAVWDFSNLSKISLIGTVKVDGARVLDAIWKSNDEFVSVGPKHIKFYKVSGRNIAMSKGVFGKLKVEPLVSVACAFNKLFTGTDKGNLITWEGANASTLKNVCKNGSLFTLYYYDKEKVLFAGGFDGMIIGYSNAKLEEKYRIDIQKVTNTPCDVAIRSLDANAQGELLVGTRGGEIVEISLKTKTMIRSIMKSHYESELWAVTINPMNSYEVASGGGDKTLRIWDLKTFREKKFMMFPEDFRAIDWSSNGQFIIIGTMPGLIYYVSVSDMKRSAPFKSIFFAEPGNKKTDDKDKWIQELKISPNNEYVAFGSHCGIGNSFSKIQVLQITGNAKAPLKAYVTVDPKITSALTHLDWSTDNDRIVCNSLAFELKYVSIGAKSVIKSSSCVWEPDLWATWTCIFGYPVQGIWPPASTGYVVNYTCLSNNKKVVATGDDFSLVKLFKAPSVVEQASYKAYGGHSSHVPKVRFTPNDKFIVSVGGNDKSVFIWETDFGQDNGEDEIQEENNEEEQEQQQQDEEENNEDAEEEEIRKANEREKAIQANKKKPSPKPVPKKGTKPVAQKTTSNTKKKIIEEEAEQYQEEENEEEQYQEEEQDQEQEEQIEEEEEVEEPEPEPPKKEKAKPQPQKTKKQVLQPNQSPTQSQKASTVKSQTQSKSKMKQTQQQQFDMEDEDAMAGDMAGNPDSTQQGEQWRSTIDFPDNISDITPNEKAPNIELNLGYVFGYRTKDTRNNVRYLAEKSIAYHAGNLGIIHDLSLNKQTFFKGHKEEILSFAINSSKTLIATGEGPTRTEQSQIIIWKCADFEEELRITLPVNGINVISFSPSSEKIVCTCLDSNHMIYVISVKTRQIITSIQQGQMKMLDLCFKSENEFVTVGIKHYKFWTLKDGKELICKEGKFAEKIDIKIGVVSLFGDKIITGSASGQVVMWKDDVIHLGKGVHSKNIDTLFTNSNIIISGGRDMIIVIMEQNLNELRRFPLDLAKLDSVNSNPRAIDVFESDTTKILVGTLASEIYELQFEDSFLNGEYLPKNYMAGHFSSSSSENNQVTGIVYLSTKSMFCTIGEDATLRFWNNSTNAQDTFLRFDISNDGQELSSFKPTAMSLDANETFLAIGFSNGSMRQYSTKDFSITKEITFRKYPVNQLKYSPDGQYLASSTSDETQANIIDIFAASDLTLISTLKGHLSPINRIDWSTDINFISSSTQDGELRFFNFKKGIQMQYNSFKNETWATWTRNYGWPLIGYYDSTPERITSCERIEQDINNKKLIAIGDEKGEVRIYNYPIMAGNQKYVQSGYSHGNKVNQLKISEANNEVVMFTSGLDGCLFKWSISSE